MTLKIMQAAVFFGVLLSQGAYHWAQRDLAAFVVALLATIFATAIVVEVQDRLRKISGRAAPSRQPPAPAVPPMQPNALMRLPGADREHR